MPLIPPGRRKGNEFWIWRKTVDGREYEISTKCRDKDAAQRAAVELEREIRNRRAVEIGTPQTFADAAAKYRAARPGLAKADDGFLAAIEREIGDRPLAALVPHDIVAAGRRLYPGRTNATVNRNAIAPAAAVLHHAAAQGWCPYRRIARLREEEPETRTVGQDVAARLIEAAPGAVERAFLVCLFVQGWRVSEPLRLAWDRVDIAAAECDRWIAKRRRWRRQALDAVTVAALANLPAGPDGKRAGFVFPWRTRSGVYKWLRPLCRRLGVRFTPHMARHSAATWARRGGADLKAVMRAYGWDDVKSVLRYADVDVADQRATLARTAAALAGGLPGKKTGKSR